MNEKDYQHWLIQHAIQGEIRALIAVQGFAIRHVLSNGTFPPFAYTVGLPLAGYPELLISGLSLSSRTDWLLDLGFRMNGIPPSEQCGTLTERKGGGCQPLHDSLGRRAL